jgi:hypothetical protein
VVDPVNSSAQYSYDATGNILSIVTSPITAVSVVGFGPATGPAGTLVTIGGTGFDTIADTTVNFNGTAASPSAVTATSITVAVPAGAGTGPVTVTASGGSVTSSANFTVSTPTSPQIASFGPGTVTPGATVTITGSNFDSVYSKVEIDGRLAAIVSASATSIVATVPMASSGRITVEGPAGSITSTSDLIVAPAGFAASAVASAQRIGFPASGAEQSASVTLGAASQVSLILFDATPGQIASVVETVDSIGGGQFQLYGPDGTLVGSSASTSNAANSLLPPQSLNKTGTYVVAVTSASAGGSASLTIYDVPLVVTAASIGGPAVTTSLATPGEVPTVTFSGTAGQTIRLVTQIPSAVASGY